MYIHQFSSFRNIFDPDVSKKYNRCSLFRSIQTEVVQDNEQSTPTTEIFNKNLVILEKTKPGIRLNVGDQTLDKSEQFYITCNMGLRTDIQWTA